MMVGDEDRKLTLDEHFEITWRKFEMTIKENATIRIPLSELKDELNMSKESKK